MFLHRSPEAREAHSIRDCLLPRHLDELARQLPHNLGIGFLAQTRNRKPVEVDVQLAEYGIHHDEAATLGRGRPLSEFAVVRNLEAFGKRLVELE